MVKNTITKSFLPWKWYAMSFFLVFVSLHSNGATFIVDSNADTDNLAVYAPGDGTNTLRKCIRLANTAPGLDAIQFAIIGSTVITNTVSGGAWLEITDQVTIDGYTQTGAVAGNPLIELNGAGLGNTYGIHLNVGSSNSIIKGLIIYGVTSGIRLENGTNGHTIAGCYIGVDNTGNGAAPSSIAQYGIHGFSTSDNTIGGNGGAIDRNIIGHCGSDGIRFEGFASNNEVIGNYIGIGANGVTNVGNTGNGIHCTNGEFFKVGGIGANEGNVISSNQSHAVSVFGALSKEAIIQGNIIGLTADGSTARFNFLHGIDLNENEDSQIGGTDINARNIIGNNGWSGISVISSPGTTIENNYIGLDITGLIDMGNFQHGIILINSADVTIGGMTTASRNIIGGNVLSGISIEQISPNTIIKGNYIGIGADGATVIKNDENGIISLHASHNMIIGGPTAIEGNVISGNGTWVVNADPDDGLKGDGIKIEGTDNHLIQNNYIGTDATGLVGAGNHWAGISINNNSDNNDIFDNLISDNRNEGIWIFNGSDNNEIYRNIIGESANGSPLGNWDFGIYLITATSSNIIGGSAANANTISHTRGERPGVDGDGITIVSTAGNFNQVTHNNIHCNGGKGILRSGAANENQAAPVITASNANNISGTGDNGRTIHVYRNLSVLPSGCDCEGESLIGTAIVAGGTWSLVHNLGLSAADAEKVVATQTSVGGSTSEFADCLAPPLPVELIYFEGKAIDNFAAELYWSTASEINNDKFEIEKSRDAINWERVGEVYGAGNSSHVLTYSFEDHSVDFRSGGWYYRLRQIDFDGTFDLSPIIYIEKGGSNHDFMLYPNPASDLLSIRGVNLEQIAFSLFDISGVDYSALINISSIGSFMYSLDISQLPVGSYVVRIGSKARKIIKH